ncbi:MAG TPA: glycosyltransferase [Chthoniobacterales bacterium]|nr:glycosyltransferase [Chthoniobacterales bacterium]
MKYIAAAPPVHTTKTDPYPIIVHSHLGWDWVWQRPQQFLSRFSKRHPILFIEAPYPSAKASVARATLREISDYPNIIVLQMEMPAARWNDGAWVDKKRRQLVQSVLAGPLGKRFESPVQWFYDPMAVTAFAGHLNERAIVYDCMDELSLFRGSPPELVRRERELLAVADVVFAGGPKIWRAKREFNKNCFSFGCGVDAKHFARARNPELPVPQDIADRPHPVYGYVGVVDERIDYDLLAALADHGDGSVVIVGPSTKVDPATFPQRPNLYWLGGRDYSELPAYAKGFDVCLMPFAINDATAFINPTKALEYMGTGRPIVSTAIDDVVDQFSEVVAIARDHTDFILKARASAARPDERRIRRGLALVRRNSWESIVRQLEQHIAETLASKRALEVNAA